jgi:hypothetical protein
MSANIRLSTVVNFPRHKLHRCNNDRCFICNGGLASCVRCGGGEGSLPTDCPGMRMSAMQCDAVYSAVLDYREDEGGWVDKPSNVWEGLEKCQK